MAYTLLTPQTITREQQRVLFNKLKFLKSVNRQFDKQFGEMGATTDGKKGPTLYIRMPNNFLVGSGGSITESSMTETSIPITVSTQKHVVLPYFTAVDFALTIDDFSKRYLDPAAKVLVSNVENDALSMTKDVYNFVGTPGALFADNKPLLDAKVVLDQTLTPEEDRYAICSSSALSGLAYGMRSTHNPQSAIAQMFVDSYEGKIANFHTLQSELIISITNGTHTATDGQSAVYGGAQSGASLVVQINSDNATTVKKGEVFTVALVNAINQDTKISNGTLQKFVVTSDATCDSTGVVTLAISPSIVLTGAKQNVTAGPGHGAAIVWKTGAASTGYLNNITYHKDAFVFATTNLALPASMEWAKAAKDENLSIRMEQGYDITNDKFISRLDVLYGYVTVRPQLACRITI